MKNASDLDLISFLNDTEPENILSIIEIMNVFLQKNVRKLHKMYKISRDVPPQGSAERNELSTVILKNLRYFGSHGVAYIFRKFLKNVNGIGSGHGKYRIDEGIVPK